MILHKENLLEVNNLRKFFPVTKGLLGHKVGEIKAVDGVSLKIKVGETLGLAGESGCGKTTVARCITRLVEPSAGEVCFRSRVLDGEVNLLELERQELKAIRKEIQMIFQDPVSSLNARMSIRQILNEPFVIHRQKNSKERIVTLMEVVGLKPDILNRFPHELSGGQKQRIGIARALALNPKLIIADEPVSALDVSVQGQVLNLMEDLQEKFELTCLFITHDLSVIAHISNRVGIMYLGKIVELASVHKLLETPLHPYSEALLSAIPRPDPEIQSSRIILKPFR